MGLHRKHIGAVALAASLAAGLGVTAALAAEPVRSTPLARADHTVTGQPLAMPQGPLQVVVQTIEIPAGGRLPVHKHPYPRYAYVLSGRLRVTYVDAKLVKEVGPGDFVVEAIDQWHQAEAVGADPVKLLVIDYVPPGEANVVAKPD